MKKNTFASINRAGRLVLIAMVILFISVFLAVFFRRQQLQHQVAPTADISPVSDISRLEMPQGQQMQSDSFNFTTDVSGPSAMQLPLRTRSDFAATASARVAHIITTKGPLTVTLYADAAPLTVANFIALASSGFYDDLRFHRVVDGFVAQIGDPASRGINDAATLETLGTGYPGYRIEDEFGEGLSHDAAGVLSMANINIDGSYPNSGGSQFFITLSPLTYLDGRHAIFGRVTEGLDVLPRLKVGDAITKITFD